MMLQRLEEQELYQTSLIGAECKNVIENIQRLIDIIFGPASLRCGINFDFFDVKGTVLLYGVPGVGKTTIAKNCLHYALQQYGVESYTINVSDIIVSGLGETVKNFNDALSEFRELDEGILLVDEIDRFFVNRKELSEISELKRLLIEFMGFIDRLSIDSRKLLIGCTNVYDQIDDALKRRFSISKEIGLPTNQEKLNFIDVCFHNIGKDVDCSKLGNEFLEQFETMDSIKSYFRKNILNQSTEKLIAEVQKQI